ELPDKTFVATLVLTTRYRPLPVSLGVASAFAVHCAVAVLAGSLVALLPATPAADRRRGGGPARALGAAASPVVDRAVRRGRGLCRARHPHRRLRLRLTTPALAAPPRREGGAASGQRPAASGQRSAVSGQRPARRSPKPDIR